MPNKHGVPVVGDAPKYEPIWWLTKDGDSTLITLFNRHYSRQRYNDKRRQNLFAGPGQKIVLRTADGDAMFVWRKFKCLRNEHGINCAIFRNESPHLSSELIRQADAIADFVWPRERHYTYVNPKMVRSANAGYCFIRAGWRRCGQTKVNKLLIFEKPAHPERTND